MKEQGARAAIYLSWLLDSLLIKMMCDDYERKINCHLGFLIDRKGSAILSS